MKSKPSIDGFLGGASADKSAQGKPRAVASTRITKTIRLAADLDAAVKEVAYTRWKETGKRVTEADVIEDALRKYLSI